MDRQTSVSDTYAVALAGDVRGTEYLSVTKLAQVIVPTGLFCCQGTRDDQCKLPTSAADVGKGFGVARSQVSTDPTFGVATAGTTYQIGAAVDLLARGQVWVRVECAVVAMDPVYVRITSYGGNTQVGSFRNDADTHSYVDYATLVTGARFLTTQATVGGLALVDLNLPQ